MVQAIRPGDEYREKARRLRIVGIKHPDVRTSFHRIAAAYERLAVKVDRVFGFGGGSSARKTSIDRWNEPT